MTDLAIAGIVFKLRETAQRALDVGVVMPTEAQSWLREVKRADELRQFFAAVTMFCISGFKSWRRPESSRHI